MAKKVSRTMDVWGIHRDPEHITDALKIIGDSKDKIREPLTLYVNCISKFRIDGVEIERHFDTLIWSEEADIVLLLSSIKYEDADDGKPISATSKDIVDYLDANGIPYDLVFVPDTHSSINIDDEKISADKEIPEIWFARDEQVLKDALKEGIELGTKKIIHNPNVPITLSIGYEINDNFIEIWGVRGKGLVKTDCNWVVIIDENYFKNLNSKQVKLIIMSMIPRLFCKNVKRRIRRNSRCNI